MDMNFEKLGAYIARIRKENGLSRYELASRMGYTNLSKGVNRVKDLEMGIKKKIPLIMAALKALEIDMLHVHQALADDVIEMRKSELESWLKSRSTIKNMMDKRLCHNCPFIMGNMCHHPIHANGPRTLQSAKYVGYFRPPWCPLGFSKGYEEHMFSREDRTIPLSVVVDGVAVSGVISELSPKCFKVMIESPYSGFGKYAPFISNVVMGLVEHYSIDVKLTRKGDRVAREMLTMIYRACCKVEEHIEELSVLYKSCQEKNKDFNHKD